jgi:peptide/nickel transport system permease protein
MLNYILRRLVYMVVLLLLLSVVSFVIIQLPPGNYIDTLVENMRARGVVVDQEQIDSLVRQYGFDQSMTVQYFKWMGNLLQGDMGKSYIYNESVTKLIGERLALTVVLSLLSLIITYAIAIPIGIYSATHQYSALDYLMMVLGFAGIAIPNFLLALIFMFIFFKYFNWSVGGLFSPEYQVAAWSFGKLLDFLKHLPIPLVVVGVSGTAGMIRVMRASLLDELRKQYVITARAKGLEERKLLFKYPIRVAINPMVSTIGGLLPSIVSGSTLISIVLSLPTVGPLLLQALLGQDMYLAASMVMLLSALGIIGTLLSDMLLVVVDPRIRFERQVGVR